MSEGANLDWQEWDVLASYLHGMQNGLIRTAVEFGHDANESVEISKRILAWVRAQEPES